jgi:putative intracellular protease/amidase
MINPARLIARSTQRPATAFILMITLALAGLAPIAAAEEEPAVKYVCPPCGHANEDKTYEKAGSCPICHMKLVKKKEIMNVAILVFDGVQIIDYTGPYEVFGQGGKFNVFTVSETGKTLTTAMGMSMNPSHSFESVPEPDILIVPGGDVHASVESTETIQWLKTKSESADHVMSVCNGAFILAKAGLLEGKKATTFYKLIDQLRESAPNTEVVSDQRFVDNGKVITTAGLSSGIDGSLYLISKIRGMGRAKSVALHIEYQWDPDSTFARAALADLRLPRLDPPEGAEVRVVSTEGNRDEWETRFEVSSDLNREKLTAYVNESLAELENWTRRETEAASGDNRSSWKFADEDGSNWTGAVEVGGAKTPSDPALVTISIQRVHLKKAQALN